MRLHSKHAGIAREEVAIRLASLVQAAELAYHELANDLRSENIAELQRAGILGLRRFSLYEQVENIAAIYLTFCALWL